MRVRPAITALLLLLQPGLVWPDPVQAAAPAVSAARSAATSQARPDGTLWLWLAVALVVSLISTILGWSHRRNRCTDKPGRQERHWPPGPN